MKKVLFMMTLAAIAMISCKKEIKVTDITLNKQKLELSVGGTEFLKATTTPTGAEVAWSSSDVKVATVAANGKVTAIAGGDAVITATAGEMSATCAVHVKSAADALYDMNIVDYGLFGEFSDPIPGMDKKITMTDGSEWECELRTVSFIYAWDENVQFVSGTGLIGNGWVCCFENVPFWVIKGEENAYVGGGGFVAQTLKEGQIEPYYASVGQLDPETYGKWVQYMYSDDNGDAYETEYTAMRAKTNGCFVSRCELSQDKTGYINYYTLGLYDGHIKTFIFLDGSETEDAQFAAEIEWGNLDGQKYMFGFDFDAEAWEKDKKISLLAPYASHYNTVYKLYDDNGLFTNAPERTYSLGNPAKYHKELPTINGVAADKFRMAVK